MLRHEGKEGMQDFGSSFAQRCLSRSSGYFYSGSELICNTPLKEMGLRSPYRRAFKGLKTFAEGLFSTGNIDSSCVLRKCSNLPGLKLKN